MRVTVEKLVGIMMENEAAVEALRLSGIELDKKLNAGDIAPKDYEAKKKEISANINGTKAAALMAFNELKRQGEAQLEEWATLKIEDMPKEIEFLENPLYLLSAEDLQKLSDKYFDNYTFQRALVAYATLKGIVYTKAPSYEKKKAAFEKACKQLSDAINMSEGAYIVRLAKKQGDSWVQFIDEASQDAEAAARP